jgi:two-component system CheB/CheR fusion protein
MYNLIPSDVGRPIHDIRSNLEDDHVEKDAREVLETLQEHKRELQTKEGEWYLMQAVPYRSTENTIEGVLLTFTDVSEAKRCDETMIQMRIEAAAGEFAKSVVETVRDPLVILDGGLRVVSANPSFYRTFQVSKEETEKRLIYDLGSGQWNIPELRRLLGEVLPQNNMINSYVVEHDFPGIGRRRMLLNARRMVKNTGVEGPLILLAIEDVTHRKPLRKKQSVSK